MQEAPYWMWMKRKQILDQSDSQRSTICLNNKTWEEKAFAEDAAGSLGGCIWPPRSYSCRFCNREFRSAQALGGHMNVHRKDRARLKESLSSSNDVGPHHQNHHDQNRSNSLGAQFPTDVCNKLFQYNRDPKSSPNIVASGADLSPSWVSAFYTPENFSEQPRTSAPAHSFSIAQSLSDPAGVRLLLSISESKHDGLANISRGKADSTCLGNDDYDVETEFSVGMNSFVCQNRPRSPGVEAISCKRPKTAVSSLSFFLKACSDARYHLQSEVTEVVKPISMEDLDLELRLGDPGSPKVKQ